MIHIIISSSCSRDTSSSPRDFFSKYFFNNVYANNGRIPPSCVSLVSLDSFPNIPSNNEKATSAINEAAIGAINEAIAAPSYHFISSFSVSVTPSINRPDFFLTL